MIKEIVDPCGALTQYSQSGEDFLKTVVDNVEKYVPKDSLTI